jgi:hypothetical protein
MNTLFFLILFGSLRSFHISSKMEIEIFHGNLQEARGFRELDRRNTSLNGLANTFYFYLKLSLVWESGKIHIPHQYKKMIKNQPQWEDDPWREPSRGDQCKRQEKWNKCSTYYQRMRTQHCRNPHSSDQMIEYCAKVSSGHRTGLSRFWDLITCVALLRKERNRSQFSGDREDL